MCLIILEEKVVDKVTPFFVFHFRNCLQLFAKYFIEKNFPGKKLPKFLFSLESKFIFCDIFSRITVAAFEEKT